MSYASQFGFDWGKFQGGGGGGLSQLQKDKISESILNSAGGAFGFGDLGTNLFKELGNFNNSLDAWTSNLTEGLFGGLSDMFGGSDMGALLF